MRLESLRTILARAAIRDIDIIQFNITSAYLHGTLKEEVFTEQPEGYIAPGEQDWVWRLKKGLYGVVQAGKTWDEELNDHMESEGFMATAKAPMIYVKNSWVRRFRCSRILGGWTTASRWGLGRSALTSPRVLTRSMVLLARERSDGYLACNWSGARSLCPHDRDLPGGIYQFHPRLLQPP